MFSKRVILWLAVAALLALSVSCSKEEDKTSTGGGATASPEAAGGGAVWTPKGNEGNITGAIAFTGAAPTPKKIQMDSDPVCAQKGAGATNEDVLVNDGKLQNVFVYVKSGLPAGAT